MIITFKCPDCNVEIEADETLFGTQRECPGCKSQVDVPQAHVGPGVQLKGFLIEGRIGKGGMGEVFVANQLSMSRRVALKVLPSEMTTDKDSVERFLKEARMSARLEHPNIVTVLDAGEDCGFYYLAMTYVEGQTLDGMLKRDGKLPEREAVGYALKVAGALNHAWEHHHILHRDVKPANIMLDKYGETKLLDMGLAKDILEDKSLTISGTILGTPFYMSPELAKSQPEIDFRSDIYSLGATLYHLLCGSPPFAGDNVVNILAQHVFEQIPPIQQRNPEVSDVCAMLLEVMLQKDPKDRQESWGDVIADMKRVLKGLPPQSAAPAGTKGPGDVTKASVSTAATIDAPPGTLSRPRKSALSPLIVTAGVGFVVVLLGLIVGVAALVSKTPADANGVAGPPGRSAPPPVKPVPSPRPIVIAPKPDGGDAEAERRRHQKLAQGLDELEQYLKNNPDDYQAALEKLAKFRLTVLGTPFQKRVRRLTREVLAARKLAGAAILTRLQARAQEKCDAGDREGAIKLLLGYKGPLATETQQERYTFARKIKEEARQEKEGRRAALVRLRTKFEELLDKTARYMLKQNFSAARALVDKTKLDKEYNPIRDKITDHLAFITEVCSMNRLIRDSYKPQIGRQITVQLKSGRKLLLIQGVERDQVKASKIIIKGKMKGKIKGDFSLRELAVSEKLKRVGDAKDDVRQVMRALLYLEANKTDTAIGILEKINSRVAKSLINNHGSGAASAMRRLLRLAELPTNESNVTALLDRFFTRKYPKEHRARICSAAAAFLKRYENDKVAHRYYGLVQAMAAAGGGRLLKGARPVKSTFAKVTGLAEGSAEAVRLQKRESKQQKLPLEIENSIKMRFRFIPGGAAWGYAGRAPVKPFYLGKYEVTQAQWNAMSPKHKFKHNDPKLPADDLSYDEILEFLDRLCRREGVPKNTYRLPANREWTYACSAGTRARYYFGDSPTRLSKFANYLDSSAPDVYEGRSLKYGKDRRHSDGNSTLARPGSYPPNPWGLYDMYGNLMEYILRDTGRLRSNIVSLKGGSWMHHVNLCHAAEAFNIFRRRPTFTASSSFPRPSGFRVLREIRLPDKKETDSIRDDRDD